MELGWHVTMLNIIPRPSELPFLLMEQLETGDTVRSNYWSFMVIVSYRKFLNTLLCLFRDNSLWHNHWLPFSEKIPLENALNRNEMEWYVKMSWCYKVISSVALALWNYWQTERKRDKRYVFSFLIYAKIIYWLWDATPMTHLKCQSCFVNNQ